MDAYFARQPILDAHMQVYGYELLFRPTLNSDTAGVHAGVDGSAATTAVLDAVSWSGIEKVVTLRKSDKD